jgi:hypothetical protein
MYSALAENHGNLQSKLNLFVALAPIVNLHNTTNSLFMSLSAHWSGLETTAHLIRLYELRSPGQDRAMDTFCNWFGSVCNGITKLLNITPSPYNNEERSDVDSKRPLSSCSLD